MIQQLLEYDPKEMRYPVYGQVKVGGGPGVDYAKRKEMWENKDKYIGEQLKCVYKSLTPGGSMRSPQMLGVRWDN